MVAAAILAVSVAGAAPASAQGEPPAYAPEPVTICVDRSGETTIQLTGDPNIPSGTPIAFLLGGVVYPATNPAAIAAAIDAAPIGTAFVVTFLDGSTAPGEIVACAPVVALASEPGFGFTRSSQDGPSSSASPAPYALVFGVLLAAAAGVAATHRLNR